MRNRPHEYRPSLTLIILYGLLANLIATGLAFPGFASQPDSGEPSDPIHITADRLVTNINDNTAQFSGRVHATQGNTIIKADQLTIHYQSNGGTSTSEGAIRRLTARGNVCITFDNKLAVSEQAVYISSERKLILEGPGSKVTNGQDEIVGTKITYFRDDGRVIIEGDDQNRVKGVFHENQKDLN